MKERGEAKTTSRSSHGQSSGDERENTSVDKVIKIIKESLKKNKKLMLELAKY